ncbi:putative Velvet factor-domain-containing protein [Seiridium cardinale]|uniref:Velvet factor-domain-containing protein n=1 Tax=Seiridium cardinale TaxID=138064 RepID=A0ABR2XA50_9PEZI
MNQYPGPIAHQPHPHPQQHPLVPEAGGPPLAHFRGIPPVHDQHPHHLPQALPPHQAYHQDPRVALMPPHVAHGSLPGMRDPTAAIGQREDGSGAPNLKSDQENDRPPEHPAPPPISKSDETRTYKLVCEQQPQRARMCGFGDKDRRPITPPPCIRLIVLDTQTNQEVDVNQIEHQMYVLSVDLWNAEGTKEFNLVKHSTNSPSISSTTSTSFRELENSGAQYPPQQYPVHMPSHEQGPYASQTSAHGMSYPPPMPGYAQQGHYGGFSNQPASYTDYPFRPQVPQNMPQIPSQSGYGGRYPQDLSQGRSASLTTQQPNGMYTRNLIGSLVSSAARLNDPNEKIGIWFVLQDLSVRTEGWFRLRFSFCSVGLPNTQGESTTSDPQKINMGKTPILAQCFSAPFQVYSAKKFPGVCESTPLSKCFAHQGIKIPIRKEGQEGKGKNKGSDEEDEV